MATRKSQLTPTTTKQSAPQSPSAAISDIRQPTEEARPQLTVGSRDARGICTVTARVGRFWHSDRLNPDSVRRRGQFIGQLAAKLGCKPTDLSGLDSSIIAAANTQAHRDADQSKAPDAARAQEPAESDPKILEAAERFLNCPHKFDELRSDFETVGIVGEADLATTVYLVGTSRLLDKPLAAVIQAPSSTGKSFVAEQVVELMPADAVVAATTFSPKSLCYMEEGGLEHKLVFLGERPHARVRPGSPAANTTLPWRELSSKGEINQWVPIKGKTENIRRKGPVAYIETTTQVEIFEEDASRMLSLTADTSADQTERILIEKAKRAAGKGPDKQRIDFVKRKHRAAQNMLRRHAVLIPFAEHIKIPPHDPTVRRAFDQLLSCIQAVALLQQRNREIVDGAIQATVDDYAVAYRLMVPVLRRTFCPTCEKQLDLLKKLAEKSGGQSFTMKQIEEWTGMKRSTINDHLTPLRKQGLVENVDTRDRRKKTYRIVTEVTETSVGVDGLITPAQLEEVIDSQRSDTSVPLMVSPARLAEAIGSQPSRPAVAAVPRQRVPQQRTPSGHARIPSLTATKA